MNGEPKVVLRAGVKDTAAFNGVPAVSGAYRLTIAPSGEVPFVAYPLSPGLARREGVSVRPLREAEAADGRPAGEVSGTFLLSAAALAPSPWYDLSPFLEAAPAERLGNLLVFRGTYRLPWLPARRAYLEAMDLLHGAGRDAAAAERLLGRAVALHPQAFVAALELGNLRLEKGERALAHEAYRKAYENAPQGSSASASLRERLAALSRPGRDPLPPLPNPWLE